MNTHLDELLDEQLAASAPAVRERTPALREAITEMADRAGQDSLARQQVRRRLAATAFGVTALVGAGTAAAAAGWVGWWNDPDATTHQTTDTSGEACSVTYAPRALHVEGHPVGARDRAAAMDFASKFLRDFDFATLEGARPERVSTVLDERLTLALSKAGLTTHAVSVALATDCTSGAQQ